MSEYNKQFDPSQLRSLDTAARVSACLSLAGSSFTILSFISYPPLRKPVNRLAFSIAIANVFACLSYSWGRHPIAAGRNSAWCQTQGFFITWFVMTDPLLVTLMAFNVLLTVRTKRNAQELKKIDFFGICFAFGAPFVPALVFLLWRPNGKTVYGDATMWCWISKESDILRLVAFYVPIWVMILTSLVLFALSGKQILLVRKKIKVAKSESGLHQAPPPRDRRFSSVAKAWLSPNVRPESRLPVQTANNAISPFPRDYKPLEPLAPIHSRELRDSEEGSPFATPASPFSTPVSPFTTPAPPFVTPTPTSTGIDRLGSDRGPLRKMPSRFDRIHWKYAKFAFLCTIVLLITWVPISVNRVYNNFIAPNHQIYGLYLASASCIPLHGFGNFVIYTTTSWTECREFLSCVSPRDSRRSSSIQIQDRKFSEKLRTWADRGVNFGRKHLRIRQSSKSTGY